MSGSPRLTWLLNVPQSQAIHHPPENGFCSQSLTASALRDWHFAEGNVLSAQHWRCPRSCHSCQCHSYMGIQRLELWEAECPDFPLMPRLTQLTVSFESVTGHAMLPLHGLTTLEVLTIWAAHILPSLSCLSRLTKLSLMGPYHSGSPQNSQASPDLSQAIKVRHAPKSCCCPQVLSP